MDSGSLQVMLLLFDHPPPSFLPPFLPPLSSVCTNYLPESNQEKFKRISWDIPVDESALSRHILMMYNAIPMFFFLTFVLNC